MPTNPNNGDGETNANAVIKEQQFQLLGAIEVIAFAASPALVKPFGTTTISWQIKLPTNLHAPVTLQIGGQTVQGLSGNVNFTITSTIIASPRFNLLASTALVSRSIASVTVTVDASECSSFQGIALSAAAITGVFRNQLNQAFAGRVRDPGITVAIGGAGSLPNDAAGISINIPLSLGDSRTMDIAIQLPISMGPKGGGIGGTVLVDYSVSVTVHLNTVVDAGSWCSNAMGEVVQPFMAHIVEKEFVPVLSQGIMDQVNTAASSAQTNDRQHRQYALTSLIVSGDGISFTVCPTTTTTSVVPPRPVSVGPES